MSVILCDRKKTCIVLKPNAVEILGVHFGLLKQKIRGGGKISSGFCLNLKLVWVLF